LPKGTLLTPAAIAVAASVGAHRVNVFARPRAAILSTGNEIVPIDALPGPSQIRNSNSPMLTALLKQLGCEVTDLGINPDRPDILRQTISAALQNFDLLFITGGMSMGQHDHIPAILRELQLDLKITKLRIKPGKPFVFATKDSGFRVQGSESERTGTQLVSSSQLVSSFLNPEPRSPTTPFVFGLPGNPVSAFVCTLRLAARLIARMQGASPAEPSLSATLGAPLPPNGPREFYQPVQLRKAFATPLPWRGSADIFTLASADAFLIREENARALPEGSQVLLLPIPGRDELRN
jgi:molybdopterin molybdotransferase